MITEAILNVFFGILNTLLAIIPALTFSQIDELKAGIETVFGFVAKADMFIPVNTVFTILGLMILIKNFKVLFFIINWIIRRIADVIP